jgi:hypothetical protein
MSGGLAAYLLVGGIWFAAARITNDDTFHSGQFGKDGIQTPKATAT